ncbi:hypothetical protein ACFXI0_37295 [Kitasatospora indigofera]
MSDVESARPRARGDPSTVHQRLALAPPATAIYLAQAEGRQLTVRETAVQSAETLAGLLLRSIGPMTTLGRWAVTGTRRTALAPKSNRRRGPPTTSNWETQ